MTYQRRNSLRALLRLLVPALAALLPLLALGGSPMPAAQAALPPSQADATRPSDTAETLIIRVYFRDFEERNRLAVELGAEEYATTGGYLTLWETRETYDMLVARGLRVEIDEVQTAIVNRPIQFGESSPDTFFGGYRTVEENFAYLDTLVSQYPNLAEKLDIGDTWCKTHPGQCTQPNSWNGYDLWVLHITNRGIPGPKPVFWFESGIHSREIATPEMATRFMSWLLDGYNTDPDARWLVDHHDIWVMPMVNPDGHHIVENGENTPRMQRKNADKDDGCTTFLSLGTDLNRNFPYKWGCCGGSSGSACSETYRGPAQGSEEETQAVLNKISELIPDQRGTADTDPAPITTTGIYQSMHTVAELNLYPWGWTDTNSPNHAELSNIGAHMSAANAYPPGNTYQSCQPGECLYNVDGDTMDWGYGVLGIPSFTTELGGGSFFPSFSQIPALWNENRGMLIYMAKIARTPYLLARGPDLSVASASTPITVTQGQTAQLLATANYAWTGNQHVQNVGAAEYYIDTPPWAGGTAIPMQPVDGQFNSPTEQVQATVDSTGLTLGRHLLLVRARGANDHLGHQTWGAVSARFIDVVVGGTVTPVATNTPPASTATATGTAAQPSATRTGTAVPPTGSPAPPSSTPTLPGGTVTSTATGTPTAIVTACPLEFTDVPPTNTFYPFVRCLACQGIIQGYPCGGDFEPCDPDNNPYFRPNNPVTRGQIAKIVAESADFNEPVPSTQQSFEDVTYGSPFWEYVERLYTRGIIGGYECGVDPNEPCIPPENRPYFRPNNGATRGQLVKIVVESAGFNDPVPNTQQTFTDVPYGHTFWDVIELLLMNRPDAIAGYPCGQVPSEPCDSENRPYFRPNNGVTRGQASKIVTNTFFPGCDPPRLEE